MAFHRSHTAWLATPSGAPTPSRFASRPAEAEPRRRCRGATATWATVQSASTPDGALELLAREVAGEGDEVVDGIGWRAAIQRGASVTRRTYRRPDG